MQPVRANAQQSGYEPPSLVVLGSMRDLTQTGDWDEFCFWNKTIGPPDFFQWIPVTNCS